MTTVKFIEIGRNKRTWEASTKQLTARWMYGQLGKHLASSNIGFDVRDDQRGGDVYAGDHCVGRWELTEGGAQ